MYKAIVTISKGWGNEKINVVANSYKEMKAKVDEIKAKDGMKFTQLGCEGEFLVWNVKYSYPSGKSFFEKIR